MSYDLRKQIYDNLNLKETDELVKIWQTNDRVDWSELAFDVIKEILLERLGDIPLQDVPVLEYTENDLDEEFGDNENQGTDQENAPYFYKPNEVLWLEKWLNRTAIASIGATILLNLLGLHNLHDNLLVFNVDNLDWNIISWLIAIIIFVFTVALQSAIYYFLFKAMGTVLRILMEMEFNSRSV